MFTSALVISMLSVVPPKLAAARFNVVDLGADRAEFYTEYVADRLVDQGLEVVTNREIACACGPGRVGLTSLTYSSQGPATVTFYSDDPAAQLLGTYDAICNLQPQMVTSSSIALGYAQNRIGVLLTTTSSVRLFLCDPPPL